MLIDKTDFNTKHVTRHFIVIKGPVHQEDLTVTNILAPGNRAPTYIKQKLAELKG